MKELTIDPEFRDKIPPLSEDEFSKLEQNILEDTASGWLYTSCRLGNVTFWVVYSERSDGYQIHNAYSHRMEIEGAAK